MKRKIMIVNGIRDCGHVYHADVVCPLTPKRIKDKMEMELKKPCIKCNPPYDYRLNKIRIKVPSVTSHGPVCCD